MTFARKAFIAMIFFGVVACAGLAVLGVPVGGAYILPGCLGMFGVIGLVVTWGE